MKHAPLAALNGVPLCVLCFLLSACGSPKLQSFDRMTAEIASAGHGNARKSCQTNLDTTAYLECVNQADKSYGQFLDLRNKKAKE